MNVRNGALPANTCGSSHCCSPSDASFSAATTAASSTSVSAVEAPLLSERRRSSSISFEKHNLFILQQLADDLSESDTDDDDDTSIGYDHEDDGVIRVRLRYNSDDNESVSKIMEEGREDVAGPGGREEDALLNRDIWGNFRSSFRSLDRRISDLSVDLNELSEALPLEEEEEQHLIEKGNHCCSNSRVSRSSARSSSSILGMIQEEIISNAIASGKLIEKPMPPTCNTSGRRSSHSSWSSNGGQRVSFASGSNIFRDNIDSALEELQEINYDDDYGDDAEDPGEGSGDAINADCA